MDILYLGNKHFVAANVFISKITWKFWKKVFIFFTILIIAILSVRPKLRDRLLSATSIGYWVVNLLSKSRMYTEHVSPEPLRKPYVQALYQMMKDIHDVMEVCQIPYWIEAGTLLGAVRHGGMIPWDDDIDVQIHENFTPLFLKKAVPLFQKLGYKVDLYPERAQLSTLNFACLPSETLPSGDIFFAKEKKKGELFIWYCHCSMYISEIYPLKKYNFGGLYVWGPATAKPYLTRLFGKNWPKLAKRGEDHRTKTGEKSSRHYFLIQDFAPALPHQPLEDHRIQVQEWINNL